MIRTTIALTSLLFAASASAQTVTYGWEDGNTTLGQYGDINPSNISDPAYVHTGNSALQLVDDQDSGTPQAYVAMVTDLTDGDVINASFFRYDDTPGTAPSARIWLHYISDASDIDSYAGSAGGNYDYGDGLGWDETSYELTFDSDGGSRAGVVIEVRTYSNPGDTVWIDDLTISTVETATIVTPAAAVPVPAAAWLFGSALFGLIGLRRKRS